MNRLTGIRAVALFVVAVLNAPAALAGPGGPGREGIVKLAATGSFFFVDANANDMWDGQPVDSKFRIEGGALTGFPIFGNFSGTLNDQIGFVTDTKVYIEDGDRSWTPMTGETINFFAPGVGLLQALVADFDIDNADDFAKVGTGQFVFVDANGNKFWDGQPMDGKFQIEGGSLTGIHFAGDFAGGPAIGIVTSTKVYVEDGDYAWTPMTGETVNFFAPNEGNIIGVIVGDLNGDGNDEFAKVTDQNGGTIFADLNGNFMWDGQPTDGKFQIEGGTIAGVYVALQNTPGMSDQVIGLVSDSKLFYDANGSVSWTPLAGDFVGFFAPGVGTTTAAGAGSW